MKTALISGIDQDFITLSDVNCIDADGNTYEYYPLLKFQKKPFPRMTNANAGNNALSKKGLILPSMALSCNILLALYNNLNDNEIKKVFEQYVSWTESHSINTSFHSQNTLVDYTDDNQQIIHYPYTPVKTIRLDFDKRNLRNSNLEESIKQSENLRFFIQLTGLEYPEYLSEVADYFNRKVVLNLPTWPCGPDKEDFDNQSIESQNLARSIYEFNLLLGQKQHYFIRSSGICVCDPGFVISVASSTASLGLIRGFS